MPRISKKAILEELSRLYPNAGPELNFTNPYETLVSTILAAQCTDRQVNKISPAVYARYPDVYAMAEAAEEDLYPMVKSCGFKSKAGNIIKSCQLIVTQFGGQVPRTLEELTTLPGVGRKTANVVLANAFGIPAFAVDTHVFRVSNRLGLADAKNVEETERQLMKAVPKKDWCEAHHWLILHGRRVCSAQRPKCETCTLNPLCKHYHQAAKTAKQPAKAAEI
ncbi:MAG: endonuclease III [Clostridia bacterium]|nr:endonuclease III [Clostridia bacterium]